MRNSMSNEHLESLIVYGNDNITNGWNNNEFNSVDKLSKLLL